MLWMSNQGTHEQNLMTCLHCQGKHPSILHIDKPTENENDHMTNWPKRSVSGTPVILDKEEDIGAGKDCKLSIVPVQIKVSKGSKTIQTYAFLDPGSTSTFCTENLMRRLNTTGRKTTVLLQTMGQKKPVDSYEITGLQVGIWMGITLLSCRRHTHKQRYQ